MNLFNRSILFLLAFCLVCSSTLRGDGLTISEDGIRIVDTFEATDPIVEVDGTDYYMKEYTWANDTLFSLIANGYDGRKLDYFDATAEQLVPLVYLDSARKATIVPEGEILIRVYSQTLDGFDVQARLSKVLSLDCGESVVMDRADFYYEQPCPSPICIYSYYRIFAIDLAEPLDFLFETPGGILDHYKTYNEAGQLSGTFEEYIDETNGNRTYFANLPAGRHYIFLSRSQYSGPENETFALNCLSDNDPTTAEIEDVELAINHPFEGKWNGVSFEQFTSPGFKLTSKPQIKKISEAESVFGFLETSNLLRPLASGDYQVTFSIEPIVESEDFFLPEFRFRLYTEDGLKQKFKAIAVKPGELPPTKLTVDWESDGISNWRMAVDLLSFGQPHSGGIRIKGVSIEEGG